MAARKTHRRRKSKQDEGLGGLLFLGVLFAWFKLGPVWTTLLGVLAITLIVTIIIVRKRRAQQRLLASGIAEIDQMNGQQFEERLAAHFRQQGYRVDVTPYQGDFGADLIIDRQGVRTAIQAKRWKGNVGGGAVQEIVSAKGYYKCQQAMVVTNSTFTQAARQLAAANGVTLWDRAALIRELGTKAVPEEVVLSQKLQW
jgi:restriction system protein